MKKLLARAGVSAARAGLKLAAFGKGGGHVTTSCTALEV
jgi:hypothetical protein